MSMTTNDSVPPVAGGSSGPPTETPSDERRGLRVPLLLALVVSAAAALFVQPRVVAGGREGDLAPAVLLIAPIAFTVVIILTALDAWRAARRSGFFPGRSVLLVAGAAVFIGLLLPETLLEYRARTGPPAASAAHYEVLARSSDARVRALVMELAGLRPVPDAEVKPLLLHGLKDKDPLVSQAALLAVSRRAGGAALDLGSAAGIVAGW
jgi:hypothetical protein